GADMWDTLPYSFRSVRSIATILQDDRFRDVVLRCLTSCGSYGTLREGRCNEAVHGRTPQFPMPSSEGRHCLSDENVPPYCRRNGSRLENSEGERLREWKRCAVAPDECAYSNPLRGGQSQSPP